MTGAVFRWLVTTISTLGYAGVVGLMALESVCIPLPSEIIMSFAGYLASTDRPLQPGPYKSGHAKVLPAL